MARKKPTLKEQLEAMPLPGRTKAQEAFARYVQRAAARGRKRRTFWCDPDAADDLEWLYDIGTGHGNYNAIYNEALRHYARAAANLDVTAVLSEATKALAVDMAGEHRVSVADVVAFCVQYVAARRKAGLLCDLASPWQNQVPP